jgi:hypothetical protein
MSEQDDKIEAFMKHLREARERVLSWPEWKQNIKRTIRNNDNKKDKKE